MKDREESAQEYARSFGYAHPLPGKTIEQITKESFEIIAEAMNIDTTDDPINHPKHYTKHPSGVECIQITEHMGFNLGNAIKYIWRADLKGQSIQDLEKAIWYVKREIERRSESL